MNTVGASPNRYYKPWQGLLKNVIKDYSPLIFSTINTTDLVLSANNSKHGSDRGHPSGHPGITSFHTFSRLKQQVDALNFTVPYIMGDQLKISLAQHKLGQSQ